MPETAVELEIQRKGLEAGRGKEGLWLREMAEFLL